MLENDTNAVETDKGEGQMPSSILSKSDATAQSEHSTNNPSPKRKI